MPWVAAATLVVGAYGASQQSKAGKQGAAAQQAAADAATAEERRQFDINQANQAPWLQFGRESIDQLRQLNAGDYSGFLSSPDYLAARDLGTQQLDYGATSQGNLWGGGADADRIRLGQQLATQYLGNFRGALQSGAGMGQSSANQLGAYGQNYAQSVGQNAMTGAQARASSYANTANAWGNFGNQLVGALGQGGWGEGWNGGRTTFV